MISEHSKTHCRAQALERKYDFGGTEELNALALQLWNSNASKAIFHGKYYKKLNSSLISMRLLGIPRF
jgi:hypothetical protein